MPGGWYQEEAGDDPGFAFEGFGMFRCADITMVNLETPVTLRGSPIQKPFNFRVRPEFAAALSFAGIAVVNIANNHIFDFGPEGLFDTISYLDSLKIHHVGAGRNLGEAHAGVVCPLRGIRIGFLGYYGGGEAPGATATSPGVARRRLPEIRRDIEGLRTRDSVDFVVVNLHWGTELADHPDDEQQEFAHDVIDAGADAVIGHHPHVLQGIERYHGGVIVYSLGNLLFGGNSRSSYDTGMFEISFDGKNISYRFLPLRVRGWRLGSPSREEERRIEQHVKDLSAGFAHSIFTN